MNHIRKIGELLAGIGLLGSLMFKEYAVVYFWTMMIGAALLAIWGFWWWKNWYFAK